MEHVAFGAQREHEARHAQRLPVQDVRPGGRAGERLPRGAAGGAGGVGGRVAAVDLVVQPRLQRLGGHVEVHLRGRAREDVEACGVAAVACQQAALLRCDLLGEPPRHGASTHGHTHRQLVSVLR